jgi:death on curing protein
MRYLSLPELLLLHRRIIEQSGGATGVRDLGMIESALAQPRMTFGGADLYPAIIEKASAIAFSLIKNHPFVDGKQAHWSCGNGDPSIAKRL